MPKWHSPAQQDTAAPSHLSSYSLQLLRPSVPVWANTEPSLQNEWKTSFGRRWPNTSGILLRSDHPITALRQGCGTWGSPSGCHSVFVWPPVLYIHHTCKMSKLNQNKKKDEIIIWMTLKSVKVNWGRGAWNLSRFVWRTCCGKPSSIHTIGNDATKPMVPDGKSAVNNWCNSPENHFWFNSA